MKNFSGNFAGPKGGEPEKALLLHFYKIGLLSS